MPRIPHLPGSRAGNDDLTVPPEELGLFLERPVLIVEKLDGIALTIGWDDFGGIDCGMKPDWKSALGGRVLRAARRWVRVHEEILRPLVEDRTVLYGEWLLHRLVTFYSALPAAVVFHGARSPAGVLLPRDEVNARFRERGFATVEPHFRGVIGRRGRLSSLLPGGRLFGRSGPAEGFIVERQDAGGSHWAKWVAPHYRQPWGRDMTGEENVVKGAGSRPRPARAFRRRRR